MSDGKTQAWVRFTEKLQREREALDEKWGSDRDEPAFLCIVTKGMQRAVDKWLAETVYPQVIEHQKSIQQNKRGYSISAEQKFAWDTGVPYSGAIGGGLSYCFAQTSIGNMVRAEYNTFDQHFKLDLIDHSEL